MWIRVLILPRDTEQLPMFQLREQIQDVNTEVTSLGLSCSLVTPSMREYTLETTLAEV
jgi:hypothetical protein